MGVTRLFQCEDWLKFAAVSTIALCDAHPRRQNTWAPAATQSGRRGLPGTFSLPLSAPAPRESEVASGLQLSGFYLRDTVEKSKKELFTC